MKQAIKIGIVHDDIKIRVRLHTALGGLGHDVCIDATTVQQMIDSYDEQRLDLLIVKKASWDAEVSKMGRVRLDSGPVPVILLVGKRDDRSPDVTLEQNVLAVLEESATQDSLVPVVELVVEQCRRLREMRIDIGKLRQDFMQSGAGTNVPSQSDTYLSDS